MSSPEDQKVTFIELFFDLVFVFSVTQVVGLLHHGVAWDVVGQGVLAFWLVWWAWTQFTWALNAADTTHPVVEIGTFAATAVAFFMAVALPHAFLGGAVLFAVPYVLVRLIGLGIYSKVASEDPRLRDAVRRFTIVSMTGLVAVLAGALFDGWALYVCWGLAILLDVLAAMVGARHDGWNLHPEHFAERHGLFVIIALGETLIVAAGGLTGSSWSFELLTISILAVGVTCGLWWTYFAHAKTKLDRAVEALKGEELSSASRDAFSLLHFPMICGIIAYAAVIEESILHPVESMHLEARVLLAAGLLLFVGGMALAIRRATGRMMTDRLLIVGVAALAIVAIPGLNAPFALLIALIATATIGTLEYRRYGSLIECSKF